VRRQSPGAADNLLFESHKGERRSDEQVAHQLIAGESAASRTTSDNKRPRPPFMSLTDGSSKDALTLQVSIMALFVRRGPSSLIGMRRLDTASDSIGRWRLGRMSESTKFVVSVE